MYFCPCIEVDKTLLIALTDHNAFSLVEVNVFSVQHNHFSNTHSRRSKKVNDCQIPCGRAAITHQLQCLVSVGVFDQLRGFYFMNPPYRAFQDEIFILKPRKEAGQYAPDIVNRHLAGLSLRLVGSQIFAEVFRS